ncbi:methylamine utilization protein MauD [Stakelama sp. CBK3Z-3]|uniref:Methylamine utilization protein MauD n=1 Tax=Stakelama flava TaxID=2860338 RepID=A0ABS6XK27_9SPHN|nr:thioredoxin-like domain-containing protein [Stakelama flava]MBW4330563.1 methylamine utilization protein MauD [Stakelama flava]
MLIASNFFLWVCIALLFVAVIALARQLALLRERIAPLAVYTAGHAPKIGDPSPVIPAHTLDGRVITLGGRSELDQPVLLLFVATDCPVSTRIIPSAMVLSRAEQLRLVFVGDGDAEAYRAMVRRFKAQAHDFVNNAQIRMTYQVSRMPSAILLKGDGTIAASGLVNSREHLETLVVTNDVDFDAADTPLDQNDRAEAVAMAG